MAELKTNPTIKELKPSSYTNLQAGLITESAVSLLLTPNDSVMESINFHFDKIGSATVRLGSTKVDSTLGSSNSIQGLFEYRDAAGVNNWLMAFNSGKAYYLKSGSFTSAGTPFSSTAKIRSTQFLNQVFSVDGVSAPQTWTGVDGATFGVGTNVTGAPTGAALVENFRSRVWMGNTSSFPSRIYFSSLPSAAATPVITWNTNATTGNWIDVAPQDGDQMTAIKRGSDAMLVFKTNHIYRVWSINQTEPDPQFNVGTYSAESVVEAKDGIYFHHSSGFFKYSGGALSEISRPIIDVVNNIPSSQYSSVAGWLEADGDHVCWSIGNVSYRGKSFNNVTVRYTISTQVWTTYSYPTPFVCSSKYNDGTTLFTVVGDNIGNVFKVNVGNNDNGTPIYCSLVHSINTFDGSLTSITKIKKMCFIHEGLAGFKIQWATTEDRINDWSKTPNGVSELGKFDTYIQNCGIRGRGIQFRISGAWSGAAANVSGSYSGYEILEADSELTKF